MAFTHPTTIRNAIVDLLVDKLDLGSANAAGALVIKTSGGTTLATLNLSNPAFGAAASGAATASAITSGTAVAAGTMAKFELQDRDRAKICEGTITITGGGGDLVFSGAALLVAVGDPIAVSAFTYNGPA
jgi:hypothetical protein